MSEAGTKISEPLEVDPRDDVLLEKIGRLRVLAWREFAPTVPVRTGCWLDQHESSARHWAIFCGGEPIAAARMSVHQRMDDIPDAEVYAGALPEALEAPIASFNRLVVHPAHRGKGLSHVLDKVRMDAVVVEDVASIVVATPAGPKRLTALAALGFRPIGGPRPEPVGHPLEGLLTQPLLCDRRTGAQLAPTSNGMGWSGPTLNDMSYEFVRYAATCEHPVLDIGAAYGVATIPALAAGATVYANDVSSDHLDELRRRTPREYLARLNTVLGHYPRDLRFPGASLSAVHASQVLHFLSPQEVEQGLQMAFHWLVAGGRLFLLAATPYQGTHGEFIKVFSDRKASGDAWPGVIEDVRTYNAHWSADLVPSRLHVFDDDVLSAAVEKAGFVVESARLFSRAGLPSFCRLDGRENLGLIARKPFG